MTAPSDSRLLGMAAWLRYSAAMELRARIAVASGKLEKIGGAIGGAIVARARSSSTRNRSEPYLQATV